MLANLRAKGFYLYPGVPNTTAITQETDQSFGEFKNCFRRNLKKLTNDRLELGRGVSFGLKEIGLLVFGGVDHTTNIGGYLDSFARAFNKERNLDAWAAVGAVPLTEMCLCLGET